jgi:4-hydroxythreonine-4-phosphate dehydrogenase
MGEPAGIGPDLCLALAEEELEAKVVVVGDPAVLERRAQELGNQTDVRVIGESASGNGNQGQFLDVIPVPALAPVRAGHLDPANAAAVLQTLRTAGQGCLDGRFQAVVTAPVHKGVINDAGIVFSGHTEFFAELCGGCVPVMMLAAPGLRVALATTHLPLRLVADAITSTLLERIVVTLERDLQRCFALERPRVLVCGLNPHAGEGGHLGVEERDTIAPTLERLRGRGIDLIGPLPADTVFTPQHLRVADVVLAMYHDQGLPVLKHMGFGNAVNITLGLPFVRTSVDHGTALPLAGTGKAESGSLVAAVRTAIEMAATASRR